ncbi:dihydrofolate reductase family protein [Paenibacillus sp. NPDC058910]|uniref:dihydrofolate reductase family protein n=1 Tax=Paenibacillus sp. NPDC058910 TaxID=3346670 RepID=UPI0036810E0D
MGGSHPIGGVPMFVVTHHVPETYPKGATPFTFVTEGIEAAVHQAKLAAGDENVSVGTASIAQQCLQLGLLDEIYVLF